MGQVTAQVWTEAHKRLTHMINHGDPHEGVLAETLVGHPLEDWARAVSAATNTELSLVLPMALVVPSACAQGGVRLEFPLPGGAVLRNPITLQHVGLAGSGVGKTTVLDHASEIVKDAMHASVAVMADWVRDRIADGDAQIAAPPMGQPLTWTADQWRKCYAMGVAGTTIIGSATQEALRNGLSKNGSHQVVMTAEADLLEEVGRYNKDGGSVSIMLHGWDGADIIVQRAKSDHDIAAPRASLPMVVLMQPAAFETAAASPMFMDRGVLHRWMITSGDVIEPVDPNVKWSLGKVLSPAEKMATPLWTSRGRLTEAMITLAQGTAEYRASMAAHANWTRGGFNLVGVDEPVLVPGWSLTPHDAAAVDAYSEVQHIREMLMRAARVSEDPDATESTFFPLAARYTSLVLRIAAAYTLAVEPTATTLRSEEITDAATRLVPWLWGHWRTAVNARDAAAGHAAVEATVKVNPKGKDMTVKGATLRSLGLIYKDRGVVLSTNATEPGPIVEGEKGTTVRGVHYRARDTSRMLKKTLRAEHVQEALDLLEQTGYVEKHGGVNVAGKPYYRLTVKGMRAAAGELK